MASLQYVFDSQGWINAGSAYLTYSEGFLSGGLSEAPSGELEVFEPEEVENWELGLKLDFLDRRLRLNAALFHSDYTNPQLTALVINALTNSPAPATVNAARSRIMGIELETLWLPTESLLLTFNMTINDGEISEFDDVQLTLADPAIAPAAGCQRADLTFVQVDSCPNDRTDENLPRLPERTYYLAAEYIVDSGLGQFMPRVQASWKFHTDYCFDSASCRSGLWLEDRQTDLGFGQ